MFNKILQRIFFIILVASFLHSNQSRFWNTFLENPTVNSEKSVFKPFDFTIINSSNVWGETEPCG